MREGTFALRARSLVLGPGRVVPGGMLLVRDGRVAQVSGQHDSPPGPVREFPSAVVLPGLVNAHAHLDLSPSIGGRGHEASFTAWLRSVRDWRLAVGPDHLLAVAREGAELALEAGTTSLVDVSSLGLTTDVPSPMRRAVLFETTGFDPSVGEERLKEAIGWLESSTAAPYPVIRGLAPHAPYSVSPWLIRETFLAARRIDCPWSIHLAEDPAEAIFLRDGTGPFAQLLADLGIPTESWTPPGCGPVEYLARLGVLGPGSILVHAGSIEPDDVARIRASGATVVFCPGTHRFFNRRRYPVEDFIRQGVPVAIGTDSRASNDRGDLSILPELAWIHQVWPGIPEETLLAMATVNGHRALGCRFGSGRLDPGEPADLIVVEPAGSPDPSRPLEATFQPESRVVAVLIAGEWAWEGQ